MVLKICENRDVNFDELLCMIPKFTFAFLLFLLTSISYESVGTKEVTILHSFLAFSIVRQRKRHCKLCKGWNMHS